MAWVSDRTLSLVVVGGIMAVFVAGFIVSVVDPSYQGYSAIGPAMGAVGGAFAGIAISRRNGKNGNGTSG